MKRRISAAACALACVTQVPAARAATTHPPATTPYLQAWMYPGTPGSDVDLED